MYFDTFIAMEPTAKGRPRVTKGGKAFTPSKTKDAEYRIQFQVSQLYKDAPADGPLEVILCVYRQKPKSKKKSEKYAMSKPDVDNYLKLVLDSLNGILWRDDATVVSATVVKVWTDGTQGFHLTVTDAPKECPDAYFGVPAWPLSE